MNRAKSKQIRHACTCIVILISEEKKQTHSTIKIITNVQNPMKNDDKKEQISPIEYHHKKKKTKMRLRVGRNNSLILKYN